jgi:hypothetical protein
MGEVATDSREQLVQTQGFGLARTIAPVVCRNSDSAGLSPYPVMKRATSRGGPSCATARQIALP